MTTEAPLGCIARLDRDDVAFAQRLLTLRGKKGVLDNDFLRYYLTSRKGQHELLSRSSGSTVQGIKRSEFEHVEIPLPSYKQQISISSALRYLEEKIELLREQNKTLEDTAQAIFREWFDHKENINFESAKIYIYGHFSKWFFRSALYLYLKK